MKEQEVEKRGETGRHFRATLDGSSVLEPKEKAGLATNEGDHPRFDRQDQVAQWI